MSARNPFDPARFVLGLALIAVAAGFVLRSLDRLTVPYAVLALLIPAALLLSGLVAATDRLVRRRSRTAVPGHHPTDLPPGRE
ncbi:hypothetical protein [Streptomyces alkaliterrae]|uniref:Uncharacterized protein n=1 Tax=Streptomyces alkaliterrae TaxID=2213162 RepID=A0A5P0YRV8_9ACTN|nr:hypothetical protein [Streptomyces alkaliterrae]MBB1252853.1 hypothetical protein [Streptomyces alkaliterrae]MBB1258816.1 hypothetical protein [Streptomyces alkaliterrae]MQS03061.1 hypothetical protein [Streptomyces alkaliterrae]